MRRIFVAALFAAVSLLPSAAHAATLTLSPNSGSFSAGERIIVNVLVSSASAMNAASGVIVFPTDMLSVEYLNKGSVLNFWVTEPSYSNASGKVNFEGVSLSGFQGTNGSVLTIAFRAKKAGTANVSFSSGQILANDGQGTDITAGLTGAAFTITAAASKPAPTPTPAPEPTPEPAPEPKVQKTTLTTPVISLGAAQASPTIMGQSGYPNADVVVTFVSSEGNKIFISGTTDSSGAFSVPVPHALRSGSYQVTAVVVMPDGEHTEPSASLLVPVGGLVSLDIGWTEIVYVLLLILILGGGLTYVFLRIAHERGREKKRIEREAREAENMVHKSFSLLRRDVRGKGGRMDLMEDLDEAEGYIEKEIRDITPNDEK